MSRSMFENTETAFKLKDNYSLYNAKLLFNVITKKYLVNFLTTLTLFSLKYKLPVKWILKKTLYKHFCGGVDINECEVTIQGMKKMNVNSILDYSVEALKTELDFDKACKKKMEIVDLSFSNESIPFAVFKSRLPVGSSAKIISGLFINALAIDTLCFSPPESCEG